MTAYRLVAEPAADRDIEGAFGWYQSERAGLGLEFLDELRVAYGRIADGPLKYRELRSGLRWSRTSWSFSPSYMPIGILRNGKLAEANPAIERTGFAGR